MKSENDFPNEDMQFAAYKSVLEGMNGKQVVIRTLDIGGDKKLSYFQFEEEMNPFLGVRAVRFCLSRKDIFRVQLRALLRASAFGKLCIMFPMIATVAEFREAKAVYDEERAKLIAEGVTVGDVQVGIMIEIPAAAVLADQLGSRFLLDRYKRLNSILYGCRPYESTSILSLSATKPICITFNQDGN